MKKISADLHGIQDLRGLKAGETIEITGKILTMRDATCARILKQNPLPVSLKGRIVFFCGPTPAPPGKVIGSCGPTTTSRMQSYFEDLFKLGVIGFIGKGEIDQYYSKLFKNHKGVLLSVTGGIGALLASKVKSATILAFKDLGPEAIYEFDVVDFPAIVTVDSGGKAFY